MNQQLITFNIIYNDKLLNKNKIPILYYNNGDDLITSLKKDQSFINYIKELNINHSSFLDIKLYYFIYNLNNNDEEYTDNNINLQDIISINELGNNFYIHYILNICLKLYQLAFHQEYNLINDILVDESIIIDIYKQIQTKYINHFSKETFINYIRQQLNEVYPNLNNVNKEFIINRLNEIL